MGTATQSKSIKVLIADDDPIVRQVVRSVLGDAGAFAVVDEATDGKQACALVAARSPEILLLDLLMPNLPGLEALRQLMASDPAVHTVLLCSAISPRQILEALQLGARGIVLKSNISELVPAMEVVMSGRYWINGRAVSNVVKIVTELAQVDAAPSAAKKFRLTPRELQVISLITQGSTNKDIAASVGITEETVKRHLTNIFDKVGMSNRLELALFALEHGLLKP